MISSRSVPHCPADAREHRILALIFLIGFAKLISFRVLGELFLTDLLLIPAAALGLLRMRSTAWRAAIPALALMLLWLIGLMISDVVRDSPFENYARGWAKIVFFMASFVGLLWLTDARINRLMAFFLGLAGAGVIQTIIAPTEFQQGDAWKFGYAVPLGILCVILASRPGPQNGIRSIAPVGLPLGMGVLNLAVNFRSHYAMLIGTAAVSAFAVLASRIAPGRRVVTPALIIGLVLLGGIVAWGSTAAYSQLASSGMLGEKAKSKHEMQTRGDLGLLLSGRSESLASFSAISASPIIGHGSWASDRSYVALRLLMLRQRGVQSNENIASELIPSHSYIFGAWVEAGILGAAFWIFSLVFASKALFLVLDLQHPATPFAAYLFIQFLWAILFSPFGADVRFIVAGQLCAAIWVLREHRKLKTTPHSARRFASRRDLLAPSRLQREL